MTKYRLATISDNQQLIELTASSGMAGQISLRIDRQPDFFKLLNMRGVSKVFVALENDIIIGCLCVSFQQVYVGGQILPFQYICDLKVAKSFRNKGIGLELCNQLANFLLSIDADLAFLNVSKGNTKPLSFFKNRPNIPDFKNIGVFNVYQFIGKKKNVIQSQNGVQLTPVKDEIISFLNAHQCNYELGSVIDSEKLENADIYAIQNKGNIKAVMCLTDTMNVKQNVVTKLSWKLKYLLKLINTFRSIAGISKMPLVNEPVRMMYIKYLAVNKAEMSVVKLLINHARNIAYERSYSFVSFGMHEKDPLNACIKGLSKLTFNSVGMLISIKDNKALIEKVKRGIPFIDYSLA